MDKTIVVTAALRKRFETAWAQKQVILFCAPCGFGKTTTANALLAGRSVCHLDARKDRLQGLALDNEDAVLLDNLQWMKDPEEQQALCDAIQAHPAVHFLLLGRGTLPGWLAPFRYEQRMEILEAQDLFFDRETTEQFFRAYGLTVKPGELDRIHKTSLGYPLALRALAHYLVEGKPYDKGVDAHVRREIFAHYQESVYRRFQPDTRRLLLDLAPFQPFDVEFAQILTGNSRAGELLGELQQDTTMLLYDDLRHYHFWPLFRQFLLWQQEREYSREEQKGLYNRAALYYELQEDYTNALACYSHCGNHRKLSELLVKNSQRHPGVANFDEMEPYYRALSREEILASPALMCGMSMLCAVCLDYEASEAWYGSLQQYASRLERSDAEYQTVRGQLAYLDIALPQRGVEGLTDLIKKTATLLSRREIILPEFSVTSCLPSIMNGGKDFCAWSKIDDRLYQTMRLPVTLLLGRDGVGLPECAIAESKFEKGEDVSGRVLDLMGRLDTVQRKGTPDMEFALIGLLTRLRIDQGEANRAREHLQALRERFEQRDCARFLPNIDALLCRVALYEGDEEAVDRWYQESAPKDLLKLRGMLRYQYLTRAMVELSYGDYQEVLLILAPLRNYFKVCRRVMDGIHLELLTAVCRYRAGESDWREPLHAALDTCLEYQFIRPVSQYGTVILPLLEKSCWTGAPAFLERLTAATRLQAAQYPDFLRCRGTLSEPLLPAELNVLRLLCHHKSNAEIGEILGIKLPTVKTYVSRILRKLGVKNRSAVKDAAQRLHLI